MTKIFLFQIVKMVNLLGFLKDSDLESSPAGSQGGQDTSFYHDNSQDESDGDDDEEVQATFPDIDIIHAPLECGLNLGMLLTGSAPQHC